MKPVDKYRIAGFALLSTLWVAGPALAEVPVPKSAVVKEKLQPVAPKKEIQRLPLKAVTPQTQDTTTETETPAQTLAVTMETVHFAPQRDCYMEWVVKITNTGNVATPSSMTLHQHYVAPDNTIIEAPSASSVGVLLPGYHSQSTVFLPKDIEAGSQMVARLMDGDTVLAEFKPAIPPMASPSASNLSLGEGVFAATQFSVVVNNRSNTDFGNVVARFRGYVRAGDTASQYVTQKSLCIPAQGSQMVTIDVPANVWQGFNVVLTKSNGMTEYLRRDYWR